MNGLSPSRAQVPRRLRLSAILCMLLLLFASTAQVAHSHPGDLPAAKGSRQQTPSPQPKDSESLCPLCIAMHSALPSTPQTVLTLVELAHTARVSQPVSRYVSLWRFELFGRPPPAAALG